MNENALREIITRVMADPQMKALLAKEKAISSGENEVLILVGNQAGIDMIPELQCRCGTETALRLCLLSSELTTGGLIPQVLWQEIKRNSGWSRIIIPVCSAEQLAAIAVGLVQDKVSDAAAWAIKQGISLEIIRVEYGFTAKTPREYRDMLEGYARKVASFGVIVGSASQPHCISTPALVPMETASVEVPMLEEQSDLIPWSCGEPINKKEEEPSNRSSVSYTKRILTVKETMSIPSYAILRIAKSTVLTPSAIDALKKMKVEVYREGVQCL